MYTSVPTQDSPDTYGYPTVPPNWESAATLAANKPPTQTFVRGFTGLVWGGVSDDPNQDDFSLELYGSQPAPGQAPPYYVGLAPYSYWSTALDSYTQVMGEVDRHIGSVVAAVPEDLRSNTVFIMTSDHGEYAGAHGLVSNKACSVYEEAFNVPLIVSDPTGRFTAQTDIPRRQLTASVDLLALMANLAYGGSSWMTGDLATIYAERLDLAPLLVNPGAAGRDHLVLASDEVVPEFFNFNDSQRHLLGVRTPTAKLGYYANWEHGTANIDPDSVVIEYYDYDAEGSTLEMDNLGVTPDSTALADLLINQYLPQQMQQPLPGAMQLASNLARQEYIAYVAVLDALTGAQMSGNIGGHTGMGEPVLMRAARSPITRCVVAAALLAAGTIVAASPVGAGEITVTTTTDGGAGSLRSAVESANTSDDADVIVLATGEEYVLSCPGGELAVSAPLTIVGNGATIRQSCAGARVLRNTGDGLLTVRDVTLTGGDAATDGGAVLSNAGPVTIVGSTITGNRAAGDGGGVFIDSDTTLTVEGSTISDNVSFDHGGGLGVFGDMRMTSSVVSGNAATADGAFGGGLFVQPDGDGPSIVSGSTITDNHADGAGSLGGGVYVDADSLAIDTTTVSANTAGGDGGGVYAYYDTSVTRSSITGNTAGGRGGGIFSYDPALEVVSSTVAGNTAADTGGGIATEGFELALDFVTFSSNSSPGGSHVDLGGGTLRSFASVLADGVGGPACAQTSGQTEGHNYEQTTDSCGLRSGSDVVNGGPTGLGVLRRTAVRP